jgi:zinc transporter ZupT
MKPTQKIGICIAILVAVWVVCEILLSFFSNEIIQFLGQFAAAFAVFGFIVLIYFLPGLIAHEKNRKNTTAIFVLNLLTGWTVIGWIIALVWALTEDK